MSSFEKYRVHEVAKDFNMTSKAIAEILTKYATTPKNHMQVLEDGELSVIFDYLTQHNQCESMEDLFKIPAKPEQPKAAEKSAEKGAEPAKPAPQQPAKPQQPQAQQSAQAKPTQGAQQHAQQSKAAVKEQKPHQPRQVPEKRVIDTRGGGNVNLGKYDERFDRLAAGAHGAQEGGKRSDRGGKEKFQNRQKQRQQQAAASTKRRQEERDRMQKLHFEIAKKAPTKVQIPDTIGVGELASRMKKTGSWPP